MVRGSSSALCSGPASRPRGCPCPGAAACLASLEGTVTERTPPRGGHFQREPGSALGTNSFGSRLTSPDAMLEPEAGVLPQAAALHPLPPENPRSAGSNAAQSGLLEGPCGNPRCHRGLQGLESLPSARRSAPPRPSGCHWSPGSPFTCPLCLLRQRPHLLWFPHYTAGGGWVRAAFRGRGTGLHSRVRVGGRAQRLGHRQALPGILPQVPVPWPFPPPGGPSLASFAVTSALHALNCLAGPVSPRPPCRRFHEVSWIATQLSQHKETGGELLASPTALVSTYDTHEAPPLDPCWTMTASVTGRAKRPWEPAPQRTGQQLVRGGQPRGHVGQAGRPGEGAAGGRLRGAGSGPRAVLEELGQWDGSCCGPRGPGASRLGPGAWAEQTNTRLTEQGARGMGTRRETQGHGPEQPGGWSCHSPCWGLGGAGPRPRLARGPGWVGGGGRVADP
ncbi:uncharacterized protein LOC120582737 [Pteropus medius]|uniref:uncharacterized protein LOC120582737 n=1 Tax=Pteropus vampyrus TaxID=132908 RepID=UPI00196B408F|nr:uncharacterized protein LOC120582737 [Pteropus giganteus]